MYDITLICTVHKESGICNLYELYKIIGKINPEVIFEEMPPIAYDAYYKDKTRNNLETDTINKYLETHQIEHIPVDYFNIPASFFKDNDYMHKRIETISFEYRSLIDTHSSYVRQYGFKYLNSIYCNNLQNELYKSMTKALEKINDDKLFQTYKLWNDVIEKREIEIINNIYSYSEKHKYNRGLFFIGAAHRESIINKIQKHPGMEYITLNWNYSNYDNIL